MGIHEKVVPQRSDLSAGKCEPSMEYGKTLTANAVEWTLGAAVKIMDASTANKNFIITDIVVEFDIPSDIVDMGGL